MGQLYFDGFELGVPPDWQLAGSATTSTTTAHGYGLSLNSSAASATKSLPATSDLFVGFRYSASVSNTAHVLRLFGDGGLTEHLRIWWSTPTTLALGRAATQIATATVNEPVGTWLYIEVRATIADAGGRCVVKVDGATVIDFTGDTKNAGTASTIDTVQLVSFSSFSRYFDDFYINDATGAAPHNTFYGPCRVYALAPTGAGTQTQFTPSTGANWAAVDEQPYSATDFVSSSTVGQRDTYALADLPGSVTAVYGVRATAVAKSSDGATVSLKTVVRSGGTVYSDTATALGASDSTVAGIRSVDPATAAAWTVAGVNAAEAGFEVA